MSVEAVRWAISSAPEDLGGGGMATLLVMADVANRSHDWQVWLARDEIARRARTSKGTVASTLTRLRDEGLLVAVGKRGKLTVWRLSVEPATRPTVSSGIDRRAQQFDGSEGPLPLSLQTESRASSTDGSRPSPEPSPSAVARSIVKKEWERRDARGVPRPLGAFVAQVGIVRQALDAGWSEEQIAAAFRDVVGTLVLWKLGDALEKLPKCQPRKAAAENRVDLDALAARAAAGPMTGSRFVSRQPWEVE